MAPPNAAPRLRADPKRQPPSSPPSQPPSPLPAGAATLGVRISKLITDRGIASRREADDWIAAGWVSVGGRPAVLGQRAPADAVIDIHTLAQTAQATRVTVLMHKPIGFVSGQAEDGHEPAVNLFTPANRWAGDASETRFHHGQLRGLAPAGRLDIDSTGLLVLTQDGRIAKQLVGDETRIEKEYLVRVQRLDGGPLAEVPLDRLRHGLELDGVALRPARVSWQNEDQLRVVLREGRKRQIRRMCELVGLKVVGLKRVRIGSVVLGPLPPGQWRYLGEHERF
jgi:23S rRNA pseudouridine2604 synthase